YERLCRSLYKYAKKPEQIKLLWKVILEKSRGRPDCINSSHVEKIWKELCADKRYSNICQCEEDIMNKIEMTLNQYSKNRKYKQLHENNINNTKNNNKSCEDITPLHYNNTINDINNDINTKNNNNTNNNYSNYYPSQKNHYSSPIINSTNNNDNTIYNNNSNICNDNNNTIFYNNNSNTISNNSNICNNNQCTEIIYSTPTSVQTSSVSYLPLSPPMSDISTISVEDTIQTTSVINPTIINPTVSTYPTTMVNTMNIIPSSVPIQYSTTTEQPVIYSYIQVLNSNNNNINYTYL
ncbi:hypothetical protein PIROE2DRAFT_16652, partial [Piromyces sp. E2]